VGLPDGRDGRNPGTTTAREVTLRPFDDIDRLANTPALDKVAAPLRDAVHKVLRRQDVKDALHGVWLGHPLHPVLAQASLSCFVSAGVLDVVPRTRRPATVLIALGLLSAAPTAAAGWADYADGHEEQQRVGVVHAGANVAMLAGYVASLAARARGRGVRGALWGWGALAVGTAGATLGGHMAYHQAMGANHAEGYPHIGPGDWVDVGTPDELSEGEPTRRVVGDVGVLLVKRGQQVHALADRCAHASGPLHEGRITTGPRSDGTGSADCVVCPWHGSVFRLATGEVVHGPATAPQPTFRTRVRDGRLELTVTGYAGVPAS
jgi:nitrite reductase/ring-hydroxylating ferredoxin subunit